MAFLELFDREYAPKLDIGAFKRASGFRKMFEHLEKCDSPYIIETGTMRALGQWSDGQSTLLWNAFAEYLYPERRTARVFSIDINSDYLILVAEHAPYVNCLHGDSVRTLLCINTILQHADLVYLDSYDLDPSNPMPSAIHHLMELTAIFRMLKTGCMVVVDDCISDECGKHMLVKKFFDHIGIQPVFTGYQCGWLVPKRNDIRTSLSKP